MKKLGRLKLSFTLLLTFSVLINFSILSCSYSEPQNLSRAIGQMMMIGFTGTEINEHSAIVQEIKKYHVGSVILYNYTCTKNHNDSFGNVKNPEQLKKLTSQLQFYAMKYNHSPLFIAVNQEGYEVDTLKNSKGFTLGLDKSEAALGKIANTKILFQEAYHRGLLLKEYGVNLNLAPVADLNINPRNPGIGKLQRSFGRSPKIVTDDLSATIQAYKKAGILCTLKHFPGLGSANQNTDYKEADVTQTWGENELLPYRYLIATQQTCPLIMVSHIIDRRLDSNGLPATFSKNIINDLLLEKLHYTGLVITDDMDAVAIRKHFTDKYALSKAVLAGNDIIIYGGSQGRSPEKDADVLFKTLNQLAENNAEIRARIFAASQKIIRTKKQLLI